MRMLVAVLVTSAAFGTWAETSFPQVNQLLSGIFDDVGAIAQSFSGGPDDPRGPVVDVATRNQDARRLEAATEKANQLADTLHHIADGR